MNYFDLNLIFQAKSLPHLEHNALYIWDELRIESTPFHDIPSSLSCTTPKA